MGALKCGRHMNLRASCGASMKSLSAVYIRNVVYIALGPSVGIYYKGAQTNVRNPVPSGI